MLETNTNYILGLTASETFIIGKCNEDGDIEIPYRLVVSTGNESGPDGKPIPAGMTLLIPYLTFGLKIMKRFFLISETNEIQTELLAAYQKATSKIQMPTVGEAMAINGGNKIIDINSKKKALH